MRTMPGLAILFVLFQGSAQADQPGLPTPALLAEHAAKRFPQPVRVGDLIGRDLLKPEESQPVLGHVRSLTRRADGGVDITIWEGATLGWGGRLVSVPIEAVALLGEHVALIDYTPAQLAALPSALPDTPLAPDTTIKIGLVRPFH